MTGSDPGSGWVTVVIPAYRAEKALEYAVGSILELNDPGIHVIIVEDGSPDETWQVCEKMAKRHRQVRAFRHAKGRNLGVSETRNRGIQESRTPCIAFLDADDRVLSDRFRESKEILDRNDDVDAVYGPATVIVEDESQGSQWVDQSTFGIQTPLIENDLLASLIGGTPWHTSAVVCRKTLLDRTGLFHPSLSIAEDCHLWMRMVSMGKVVPTKFGSHLSEYRRHEGSLYTAAAERKLDYWNALSDYWSWIKREGLPDHHKRFVCSQIANWVENTIIHFRALGQTRLAQRLAWKALKTSPSFFVRRTNVSNLLRMSSGIGRG